jgi:hypothetical protein
VAEVVRSREGVIPTSLRSGSELKDSFREDAAPAGGSLMPRADKAEEAEGERPANARARVESAPVSVEEVKWVR